MRQIGENRERELTRRRHSFCEYDSSLLCISVSDSNSDSSLAASVQIVTPKKKKKKFVPKRNAPLAKKRAGAKPHTIKGGKKKMMKKKDVINDDETALIPYRNPRVMVTVYSEHREPASSVCYFFTCKVGVPNENYAAASCFLGIQRMLHLVQKDTYKYQMENLLCIM